MADAKRRRTEDTPKAVVLRSEELWLNEGNIIIRTTSSALPRTQTLYKVHKFILSFHCSAFATLFDSGPQDAFDAGSERYEELAVMDLPDADDDARNFLKALYYPEELQRHQPSSDRLRTTFPSTYAGILRLSAKYEATKIMEIVVHVLKMQWPTLLNEWDDRDSTMDPALAIRLATNFDVLDLLPVAYYDLGRCCESREVSSDDTFDREPDLSLLGADDLRRFILGRAPFETLSWER